MNKEMLALAVKPHVDYADIKMREEAARLAALAIVTPYIPKLVGALMFLDDTVSWKWTPHSHATCWSLDNSLSSSAQLNAILKGITSWKQITPIMEVLAVAGLELDKWTSVDDAQSYSRIFTYLLNDSNPRVSITITASLPGDTDECRRVITGYTGRYQLMRDEPIYKLECAE